MADTGVPFRPDAPVWRLTPAGIRIRVHVQPRSGRNCFEVGRDGVLRARVTAPPVDGAANHAVIALLAELLDVPKKAVTVVTGQRGRDKLIEIKADSERLIARLAAALARVDKL
jgi:uncharacterized protein (TIGR00251 family)